LAEGGSGLAPFAGPTAGYLVAFPLAALAAGEFCRRLGRRPAARIGVMIGAHLLILVVGAAWLARAIGVEAALAHGFTPFLLGAAIKSVAVVGCAGLLRRLPAFSS
ncbi:MAG: biotin transporter BioY, partial [Pseudomonadota bacterium]|nr:biotin transporter BioY [Pseudomonadota bacterium]